MCCCWRYLTQPKTFRVKDGFGGEKKIEKIVHIERENDEMKVELPDTNTTEWVNGKSIHELTPREVCWKTTQFSDKIVLVGVQH